MSKKLTIAVPENLYERLQKVKHKLNISAICQEALDRTVTLHELKTNSFEQNLLIKRLKLEKKAMLTKVKQQGFELGVKSAASLSYSDFQDLEQRNPGEIKIDEEALSSLWTFLNSRGYPQELIFNDPKLSHLLTINSQNQTAFVEGWLEGVVSVWQEIKDLVEKNTEEENSLTILK